MDWRDKLKDLKAKSGKTTKELADLSGLPEPTLEKIFSGATKDPRLSNIATLVHAMGFTLDDLLPGEDIKKEPHDERREAPISEDDLASLLQQVGILKPGEDLTDADLRFLQATIASLEAWFSSKQ